MKRTILTMVIVVSGFLANAQDSTNNAQLFWEKLKSHCGKAYAGRLPEGVSQQGFDGKTLAMHVLYCDDNTIRVPFFVGDDRSRTWVLTYQDGIIKLKHDHRHEDGSEDKVTQYGGTASNSGFAHMQIFPADVETATLIPYAAGNVWWITLDDTTFSYNLRRVGSDRLFTVLFDLSTEIPTPEAPWGWTN